MFMFHTRDTLKTQNKTKLTALYFMANGIDFLNQVIYLEHPDDCFPQYWIRQEVKPSLLLRWMETLDALFLTLLFIIVDHR